MERRSGAFPGQTRQWASHAAQRPNICPTWERELIARGDGCVMPTAIPAPRIPGKVLQLATNLTCCSAAEAPCPWRIRSRFLGFEPG